MTEASAEAPAKTIAGESALGRLVGVFVSPVRTFASIAARPTWLLPVAIFAGISLPVSELVLSKMDWRATVAERMARSGRTFSEAQIDQATEQMRRLAPLWDVFAVAFPFVLVLAVAAVFWGACNAFGWEVRFKQSLGVTSHAFFPGVLGSIGIAAAIWNQPTVNPERVQDYLPTNLGFFAHDADKVTHGLASSIDLFSFWTMALLVLGLSAAARTTRARMAILVVSLWALYVLGKTGAGALLG
jgi:Yip1 domain